MRKNQKPQGAKMSAYVRRVMQRCTSARAKGVGEGMASPQGIKAGEVYTDTEEGGKAGRAIESA